MLKDREVPDDIKEKLESLRRITGSYQQFWVRKRAAEDEEEDEETPDSDTG
jgi:hypothetical protein